KARRRTRRPCSCARFWTTPRSPGRALRRGRGSTILAAVSSQASREQAPWMSVMKDEDPPDGANDEALVIRLQTLTQEHADLDAAIGALEAQPHHDRLAVARLKKKKLQIKDVMQ